jgi:hypothetical protein
MNVTQMGNSTVVTAVGSDGSLWFFYQPIGGGGWTGEVVAAPTPKTSPPFTPNISPPFIAASIAQAGNSSVIAAVGSDGSLWFYWQTIGTVPWNPEVVAAAATSTSSPVRSASVAHVGNSSVIAAAHQDGTLSFYWQTIGTMGWNEELVPGPGPNNVSSVSVAQVRDYLALAAVGYDASLWVYWQTLPLSTYSGGGGSRRTSCWHNPEVS